MSSNSHVHQRTLFSIMIIFLVIHTHAVDFDALLVPELPSGRKLDLGNYSQYTRMSPLQLPLKITESAELPNSTRICSWKHSGKNDYISVYQQHLSTVSDPHFYWRAHRMRYNDLELVPSSPINIGSILPELKLVADKVTFEEVHAILFAQNTLERRLEEV